MNPSSLGDFFWLSSSLLCVLNGEGFITQINPAWQKSLGMAEADLLHSHYLAWVHPQDIANSRASLSQLNNGKSIISFVNRWRDVAGNYRWLNWEISIVTNNPNNPSVNPEVNDSLSSVKEYYAVATNISAQKAAEENLRDSEERFQLAIQGSSHGLWDWNLITNELYLSPRWKNLIGYEDNEIANHLDALCQHIHADDFSEMWGHIEAYLDKQTTHFESIHRMYRKDGSCCWVLSRAAALWDTNDQPYRMVGTYVDITEFKKIEQALQASEALLAAIFNVTKIGLSVTDEEGRFVRVNPAYCQLYGYEADELLGQPFTILLPADSHAQAMKFHQTFLSTGKSSNENEYRAQIRNKSGQYRDADITAARLVQKNGKCFKVTTVTDITERKRAEAERNRLFNLSIDMQSITDLKGHFKELNPAWERVLGWSKIELLTKRATELVHPNDRDITRSSLRKLAEGYVILEFENRFLCKNGLYKWLSWNSYPLVESQTVYSIVRDVTESKYIEDKIRLQQQFTRLVVDSIPNPIFVKDENGHFVFVNQSVANLLGVTANELVSMQTNPTHSAPFFLERCIQSDKEVIDNKKEIDMETDFVDVKGEKHFFHIIKKPFIQNSTEILVLSVATEMTERKRQEEALRRSEERLRLVTSNVPLILFAIDAQGMITFIRGKGLKLFGLSDDAIVGQSVFDLYPLNLVGQELADILQRVLKGETFTHLLKLPTAVLETQYSPLFDNAHEQVVSIIGVSLDITERHGLELKLKDTVAELETILDNSMIGVAYIKQGNFVRVNSKLENLLGYEQDELCGLPFSRIFSSVENFQQMDKQAQPLFERGQGYDAAHLIHTKQNNILWARLVSKAVDSHQLDKGSIWLIEDITLQKTAEQNLRLAATVFETTLDSIVITDLQSIIQRANPAFSKITGYSFAEVCGKKVTILASGRHDQLFYKNMWNSIRATGHWQGEIWNRKKTGEIYVGWLSISAINDANGVATQYMGVLTDISRLQEDMENMRYRANYDSLTGLPNRLLFYDKLLQAQTEAHRYTRSFALLFLDLDGFKPVNDSLGHAVGDQLLQDVAKRLQECVRESDTVARLAGDEFTIIINNIKKKEDAAKVATKILQRLQQPFDLGEHQAMISASIGITLYPYDGNETHLLLKRADSAMYQAKHAGKGRFCFYSNISS